MFRVSIQTLLYGSRSLVLLGVWSALSPGMAVAATYHVANNGDNGVPCAAAQISSTPRRTIAAGVKCLGAGDTLELEGGTYSEQLFNNANDKFPDGLGPEQLTTIRGAPGEIVTWTHPWGDHLLLLKNSGSYTKIENIRFDANGLTSGDGVKHFRQDGGTTTGFVFTNNQIFGAPNNGLFNGNATDGWIITDNTVYDSGRGTGIGPNPDLLANNMYLEGHNHLVSGNRVFYNNPLPAGVRAGNIRVASNAADEFDVHGNIIPGFKGSTGNIIENNSTSGGTVGIVFGTGDNNVARNNIVDSSQSGIMLWTQGAWSHDNNRIFNNTVTNTTYGIDVFAAPSILTNSQARNNILFLSSTAPIRDAVNALGPSNAANNLTIWPSFVDFANKDFHLQPGSLAIDMGTTLAEVTADFDGNLRPQGTGYDIGAFEFVPATNADFDGDGDVDGRDFLDWQRGFGVGSTLPEGDANSDSTVDDADLSIWENQFGSATALAGSATVVPEPANLTVVGLTLVGILYALSAAGRSQRLVPATFVLGSR